MTTDEIKNNFSHNLIRLRKARNLTQLQLAEKLNYSDKAISKWEVGSVLPDVETMSHIADYFGITVNDLIYAEKKNIFKLFYTNHLFITLLSFGLVWFLATIIYFVLENATTLSRTWLTFIISIPVSFIVLTVFTSIWFKKFKYLSVSGIFWGTIVSIYIWLNQSSLWFIFIIGVVGQILITLLALLRKPNKQK